MRQGLERLTDKERETLRLIARGHDAKSMARHLGVSVHTVNERLRFARRKLEVTSSREAARLLLDREEAAPESLGPKDLGDAGLALPDPSEEPATVRAAKGRVALAVSGVLLMLLVLAAFALSTTPFQAPKEAERAVAADAAPVVAARAWLALVDAGRWRESWEATGDAFRKLNTVERWQAASERARVPLGAPTSRIVLTVDDVPAPPHGYRMINFLTDFAGRKERAIETVTLAREGDAWRVVGYVIE